MTVTPTGEPGRYFVSSETDDLPWLVDLASMPDEPRCACAIHFSRTEAHWTCHHVRAAVEFAKSEKLAVAK